MISNKSIIWRSRIREVGSMNRINENFNLFYYFNLMTYKQMPEKNICSTYLSVRCVLQSRASTGQCRGMKYAWGSWAEASTPGALPCCPARILSVYLYIIYIYSCKGVLCIFAMLRVLLEILWNVVRLQNYVIQIVLLYSRTTKRWERD